jgi:hypothetical protein
LDILRGEGSTARPAQGYYIAGWAVSIWEGGTGLALTEWRRFLAKVRHNTRLSRYGVGHWDGVQDWDNSGTSDGVGESFLWIG